MHLSHTVVVQEEELGCREDQEDSAGREDQEDSARMDDGDSEVNDSQMTER